MKTFWKSTTVVAVFLCRRRNRFAAAQTCRTRDKRQDSLTFRGTCLPQNAVDEAGDGSYFVLYKFAYGYADNDTNSSNGSAIDIDWAVDRQGNAVRLPGVDFIMIYTGVNQESGRLGECSTEVSGVEDLHLLGVEIPSHAR